MATREDPRVPHHNTGKALSFPPQLEKNPEIHTSIQDGPNSRVCSYSRGIPSSPSQLERRPDSPEATQEVPDIPVETGEEPQASHHISRKTTRFPPQFEMSLNSPALTREQSLVPPPNLKGPLTSFWQLERFPKISIAT